MTDADEMRNVLDNVLSELSTATALTMSLQGAVESMRMQIRRIGTGTSNLSRDVTLIQAFDRSLHELTSIYNRFLMQKPALEEWRQSL